MRASKLIQLFAVSAIVFSGCGKSHVSEQSVSALVCDPFGSKPVSATQGITGTVYSFPGSLIPNNGTPEQLAAVHVADLEAAGTLLDVNLFASDLDVEPLWYGNGIPTADGDYLRAPATDGVGGGAILTNDFALHLSGQITLPDGTPDGLYQFALLSDDGSVLKIDQGDGNGYQTVVNEDGVHDNTFGCGSAVPLSAGQTVSYTLDYFQGPPTVVALVVLWRKVGELTDTLTTNDPATDPLLQDAAACGLGSDNYFFAVDQTDGSQHLTTIESAWSDTSTGVLSRWAVVPSAAYVLPSGTTNPCVN